MFDCLRRRHRRGNHPRWTPPFACQPTLAIRLHQDAPIAVPARTPPMQLPLLSPFDRGDHFLLDRSSRERTGGADDHQTTVSILNETSPGFSLVRLAICTFFCTNDQNSSISTWRRCRSLTSTCARACG